MHGEVETPIHVLAELSQDIQIISNYSAEIKTLMEGTFTIF